MKDNNSKIFSPPPPPPPAYQPSPPSSSSSLIVNSSINEKTVITEEEQLQNVQNQTSSLSSKWKLILRVIQLLCVVGSFGFQASANAVSLYVYLHGKRLNWLTKNSGLIEHQSHLVMLHYYISFMALNG